MPWLQLTTSSISDLAQGLFFLVLAVYLFTRPRPSPATRWLAGFLAAMFLAFVCIFLSSSLLPPCGEAAGLLQIPFLQAAFGALLQFAYLFPRDEGRGGARLALGSMALALLVDLVLAARDLALLFRDEWGGVAGIVVQLVLLGATLLWVLGVHLRKAARPAGGDPQRVYRAREKRALFAFAGLTTMLLAMVSVALLYVSGRFPERYYLPVVTSISMVFVFLFVAVRLDASAEPSDLMAKLIGLSLLTTLWTMSVVAVLGMRSHDLAYLRARSAELEDFAEDWKAGRAPDLPPGAAYLVERPLDIRTGDPPYALVTSRLSTFDVRPLNVDFWQWFEKARDWRAFEIRLLSPRLSTQTSRRLAADSLARDLARIDLGEGQARQFGPHPGEWALDLGLASGSKVLEMGFDYAAYRAYLHRHAATYAALLVLGAGFVALVFPLVLRTSLVKPLRALLDGVRRVNAGDLDVEVPVRVEDEVGFLAESFNRMVRSVKESAETRTRMAEIERELGIAQRIQQALLPTDRPDIPGLGVEARFVPAAAVGGDFYDFFVFERALGVLIADVSGHGVPAALIASMTKVAFSLQVPHAADPAAVLAGMNTTLAGKIETQFLTAGYVHVDLERCRLRVGRAGHWPTLVVREGEVSEVKPDGIFLGQFPEARYSSLEIEIRPGDRILLYTDGVTECMDPDNREFGKERLLEALVKAERMPAAAFCDDLLERLAAWSGRRNTFEDDVTFVVIDVLAPDRADPLSAFDR